MMKKGFLILSSLVGVATMVCTFCPPGCCQGVCC